MEAWLTALVMKPFIGIALIFGLLISARLVAWLIYWMLPEGPLKLRLFRTSMDDSVTPPFRFLPGRKAGR